MYPKILWLMLGVFALSVFGVADTQGEMRKDLAEGGFMQIQMQFQGFLLK